MTSSRDSRNFSMEASKGAEFARTVQARQTQAMRLQPRSRSSASTTLWVGKTLPMVRARAEIMPSPTARAASTQAAAAVAKGRSFKALRSRRALKLSTTHPRAPISTTASLKTVSTSSRQPRSRPLLIQARNPLPRLPIARALPAPKSPTPRLTC